MRTACDVDQGIGDVVSITIEISPHWVEDILHSVEMNTLEGAISLVGFL